jgi:UPF0755 protein
MPPSSPLPSLNNYPEEAPSRRRGLFVIIILFLLILLGLGAYVRFIFTPPPGFPIDTEVIIEEGSSAKAVAKQMQEAGYVRSRLALYLSLLYWFDPSDIKASTYVFTTPLSPRALANELTTGHFANDLTKLTLIEGERATQMAKRAAEVLPMFDEADFLALAIKEEGRLFPDTYFVPDTYTAEDLFKLLTTTYAEKTAPLREQIVASDRTEDEILILASIIEREANTKESMRLVSGILQERLRIGMALQVDASLEYVLDKPLGELLAEDLKMDSPYNTYLTSELPPTPIGNPGLDAIMAVLDPEPSEYLFYITGYDGKFYYARTFDEHRLNIARHLR